MTDPPKQHVRILPTSGLGWMAAVMAALGWLCGRTRPLVTTVYVAESNTHSFLKYAPPQVA